MSFAFNELSVCAHVDINGCEMNTGKTSLGLNGISLNPVEMIQNNSMKRLSSSSISEQLIMPNNTSHKCGIDLGAQ